VNRLIVGNLDSGTTEETVRSLFEPYGVVNGVQVVLDRETGRSRGFAFVEMPDRGEAEEAISALHGAPMGERELNVTKARPKLVGGLGYSASRS
jgi:cold-inducible RNA-binding protein